MYGGIDEAIAIYFYFLQIVENQRLTWKLQAIAGVKCAPLHECTKLLEITPSAHAVALVLTLLDQSEVWFHAQVELLPVIQVGSVFQTRSSSLFVVGAKGATRVGTARAGTVVDAPSTPVARSRRAGSRNARWRFVWIVAAPAAAQQCADLETRAATARNISARRLSIGVVGTTIQMLARVHVVRLAHCFPLGSLHGYSLHALLERQGCGPLLMMVKDENGNIFGAFLSDAWLHDSRKTFYGTVSVKMCEW